jgi:hypothetical protein
MKVLSRKEMKSVLGGKAMTCPTGQVLVSCVYSYTIGEDAYNTYVACYYGCMAFPLATGCVEGPTNSACPVSGAT